jgi:tetratricopeptide (TPR) repeat protein
MKLCTRILPPTVAIVVSVLSIPLPVPVFGQSVRGVCVLNCEGGYVPPGPVGPSPEEQRRTREAKDSREAAVDAEDKGVDALNRGDFEGAARWFREGLEYAPGDPDLRAYLNQAEQKIREARQAQEARQRQLEAARNTEAVRQLTGTAQTSQEAARTGSSGQAQQGFDTKGVVGSGLPGPVYGGSTGASRDPVVPRERRTPAITAMERQREESRSQIKAAEEKLKILDPSKDAVQVAKLKQEKSTAESKIQYLNFSIGEALDKPAPAPAPNAAR